MVDAGHAMADDLKHQRKPDRRKAVTDNDGGGLPRPTPGSRAIPIREGEFVLRFEPFLTGPRSRDDVFFARGTKPPSG